MDTKHETLRRLAENIRGLERTFGTERPSAYIPSGFPGLNEFLPGGGLPLGSLIEVLTAEPAFSGLSLALGLAKPSILEAAAWAVVDPEASFYPPAAAQIGLDLSRLILVRPRAQDAAWSFTQLLRCPDIGASFLTTPSLDNMTFRRFQLAAERGGQLGLVWRPLTALRRPCWASLRLVVETADPAASIGWPSLQAARLLHVTLAHVTGGRPGQRICLDLHHETFSVPLPAALAPATPATDRAGDST